MSKIYKSVAQLAVNTKRILSGMYAQTLHTRYLESIQYLPEVKLKELQAKKLAYILKHAVDKIPYYKSLKGEVELSEHTVFDDIKCFPVITKEMYRDHYNEFIDKTAQFKEELSTGGTSAVNVTILRDKNAMIQEE